MDMLALQRADLEPSDLLLCMLLTQCDHLELPNLLVNVLLFESGYHEALDLAVGMFPSGRQRSGDIL